MSSEYIFGQGSNTGVQGEVVEKANTDNKATYGRPRGYTFISSLSSFLDQQNGPRKPTNVSFETLRNFSKTLSIAGVCKMKIKNKVAQVPWDIVAVDKYKAQDSHRDYVLDLLKRPNRNKTSWHSFMDMVYNDIFDIDAGVIVKNRNSRGEVVELWYRDGATIRPLYDDTGISYGYIQVNDVGDTIAKFTNDDLIYLMLNPQGAGPWYGYGLAPLEDVLMAATALMLADQYNSSYFNSAAIPQAIINLGPDVTQEDVEGFKDSWISQLKGINAKWASPIGSFPDLDVKMLRQSNSDMEYDKYTKWLSMIVIARYGLTPHDVGWEEDVNRATASESGKVSNSMGVLPVLRTTEEFVNREIIDDLGFGGELEFKFLNVDADDSKTQAENAARLIPIGGMTVNKIREQQGEEPIVGGERPFVVVGKTLVYLDATPLTDLSESEVKELRANTEIVNDADDDPEEDDTRNVEPTKSIYKSKKTDPKKKVYIDTLLSNL